MSKTGELVTDSMTSELLCLFKPIAKATTRPLQDTTSLSRKPNKLAHLQKRHVAMVINRVLENTIDQGRWVEKINQLQIDREYLADRGGE